MILYALRCAQDHTFDVWFRDGDAFDQQAAAGQIVCPDCGSTAVTKAIMAPGINRSVGQALDAREVRQALRSLRKAVEESCEAVGDRFADEARAIHYGDAEGRPIYGTTSPEEARALQDEGIAFQHVPWVGDEN